MADRPHGPRHPGGVDAGRYGAVNEWRTIRMDPDTRAAWTPGGAAP